MTTATGGQRPWLPPPRLLDILMTWFSIGIQSFGGGSTTLYLIRQACITRGWLSEAEFAKDWALVQISPGINLIKITAVIGHQLRGWPGLLAAIAGLLLPSATITVLMTAGFVIIRDWPFVKAAMRGVIPATIGISVGLGLQMAQAPLSRARRDGARQRGRATGAAGRFRAAPGRGARLAGDRAGAGGHQRDAAAGRPRGRHPPHRPAFAEQARSMTPIDPMAPIGPLLYFWLFLKASLLSTGGLGNLPFLHQDLIALGWATEADFLVAMAVGQVSPGPNGLWTISLGYLTYGWLGAGLSLIAITLPTLLALVVVALHRRVETHPLVQRFTLGITLGVIGLTLGVAWSLFSTTVTDWQGVMITLGALALALTKRVPIVLVLALAALAGWLLYGAPL